MGQRAVIYVRVSRDEQTKGAGPAVQERECRAYAAQRGIAVLHVVHEDYTGTVLDRPALHTVHRLITEKAVDTVLIHHPDRLARKLSHLLLLMERWQDMGITVDFANAPLEDTPEGRMLLQVQGMVAEIERERIVQRTRSGRLQRARNGQIVGSRHAPLGYVYIRGERTGSYAIDEAGAALVRRIFAWYVRDDTSMLAIAERLTEEGVPTPRGNRLWQMMTIRTILRNTAYSGTVYFNKRSVQQTSTGWKTADRDPSQWIAIPVPPILDRATWDAAQTRLRTNRERASRNTRHFYLLQGLITCAHCGHPYTVNTRGGHAYYTCTMRNRAVYHVPECRCPTLPTRAEPVDAAVWTAFLNYMQSPAVIALSVATAQDAISSRAQGEEQRLQAELARTQARQARLLDLYLDQALDKATLTAKMQALTGQRENLEGQLAIVQSQAHEQRDLDRLRDQVYHVAHYGIASLLIADNAKKRRVLHRFEARITLGSLGAVLGFTLFDAFHIPLEKD